MSKLTVFFLSILFFASAGVFSQSKTTTRFHEKHDEAFTLFFYRNSLRMLNMTDDPDFYEMIRDIDKMKFLRLNKGESDFNKSEYSSLVDQYHQESFEDMMNVSSKDMKINVFIKEKDKITSGLIIIFEDEESFSILDIKGAVPLNRIAELAGKINETVKGNDFNWKK